MNAIRSVRAVRRSAFVGLFLVSCTHAAPAPRPHAEEIPSSIESLPAPSAVTTEAPPSQEAPLAGHLEAVTDLPLNRVCDLTPFQGRLFAALARRPLGSDGAVVVEYSPETQKVSSTFDWNRRGEPTEGGGGGQGFLRVRAIGDRLYVPDADPPYGGLGVVDHGTEGYVFLSDATGAFPPPRAPHARIPAGTAVLPRAYHVFDVAEFRGVFYASTGAVPPSEPAWTGSAPGALLAAPTTPSAASATARWTFALGYPRRAKKGTYLYEDGVWRLTYLTVFRDELYAGIQDYDGRSSADFIRVAPPAGRSTLQDDDAVPVRVTTGGAAATLRWYVDEFEKTSTLYWISTGGGDGGTLRKSMDGRTWTTIALPAPLGRPTDVRRVLRSATSPGHLLVLGENGIDELEGGAATLVSAVDEGLLEKVYDTKQKKKVSKSPFEISDLLCVSPLAELNGVVYLGGALGTKARLFRLALDRR